MRRRVWVVRCRRPGFGGAPGSVTSTRSAASAARRRSVLEGGEPPVERGLEAVLDLVGQRAETRPILLGDGAQLRHQRRQRTLAAEMLDAPGLERRGVDGGAEFGVRALAERTDLLFHGLPFVESAENTAVFYHFPGAVVKREAGRAVLEQRTLAALSNGGRIRPAHAPGACRRSPATAAIRAVPAPPAPRGPHGTSRAAERQRDDDPEPGPREHIAGVVLPDDHPARRHRRRGDEPQHAQARDTAATARRPPPWRSSRDPRGTSSAAEPILKNANPYSRRVGKKRRRDASGRQSA